MHALLFCLNFKTLLKETWVTLQESFRLQSMARVKQDLAGFLAQGETEPSFGLIDKCQMMYGTGAPMWLAPSLCTKRDNEIQSSRTRARILQENRAFISEVQSSASQQGR